MTSLNLHIPESNDGKMLQTCDVCLRRQTNCDGLDMPGRRCSICLAANLKCTYKESLKQRETDKEYIKALEERLRKTEALLADIKANGPNAKLLSKIKDTSRSVSPASVHASSPASTSRAIPENNHSSSLFIPMPPPLMHTSPGVENEVFDEDEGIGSDEDYSHSVGTSLSDFLAKMQLDPSSPRFVGESSGASLIADAINIKYTHPMYAPAGDGVQVPALNAAGLMRSVCSIRRRPQFWCMQEWEQESLHSSTYLLPRCKYDFPEEELMHMLVERYFAENNTMIPLLHQPSFNAGLAQGLHLKEDGYARVLLLVCAVGSSGVDDPRVLLDPASSLSAGWKWFNQVLLGGVALFAQPSLYDVQICVLASMFLQSSSVPHIYWTLMGTGIRMAQDIGVHRRKVYTGPPNAYDEQWKRAFWGLVILDRCTSWFTGRPSGTLDEDLDLDLPIEVDDEYWDHPDPARRFQQPPGKPSRIAPFIYMIKLSQILGYALRTVYTIKRSKTLRGFAGPDWEEKNVSQLNHALEALMDGLPPHLRWNPQQPDMIWFQQSTMLHCFYYIIQLTVYRPYLPDRVQQGKPESHRSSGSPGPSENLTASAITGTRRAARSCSHIIYEHSRRTGMRSPMHVGSAFYAGASLILNIWISRKLGIMSSADLQEDLKYVDYCLDVLRSCETTWPVAGKDRDILDELNVRVLDLHQVVSEQDTNFKHPKLSPEIVGHTDHAQPRDPFEFSAEIPYNNDPSHLVGSYPAMSSTFMGRESSEVPQYDILGVDTYASVLQWNSSTSSGH